MTTYKVTHTPGPWEACERGDYYDDGIVIIGDDRRVAVVSTEADARLIAAAPELLDALKECSSVLSGEVLAKAALVQALGSARAAVAKATGEAA